MWRNRQGLFVVNQTGDPLADFARIIQARSESIGLSLFLLRLGEIGLATYIDKDRESRSKQRANTTVIRCLVNRILPKATAKMFEAKKHQILQAIGKGRKWRDLCPESEGLLALIPPNSPQYTTHPTGVSGERYAVLSEAQVARLCDQLSQSALATAMLEMSRVFRNAIWSQQDVPRFMWEDLDEIALHRLNDHELCAQTVQFHELTANYYDETKFEGDDARPTGITGAWPVNPTAVPTDESQCDKCDGASPCTCIAALDLPSQSRKIRIADAGSLGQTAFAVGRADEVVFAREAVIAEYLGELLPRAIYMDGWEAELVRPDNGDPLAFIYGRRKGNWARKINHCCDPVAAFRPMRISGFFRLMVVAVRDILAGDEVTLSYGKTYFRSSKLQCLCRVCTPTEATEPTEAGDAESSS